MSRTRILVTGGSGFIGSRLACIAADARYPVTVTAAINNSTERDRVELLRRRGIEVTLATLDDRDTLARAMQGQQAVIHLAAAQHEAEASEDHFHRVNVEGTRALLELAKAAGVRRFVHGSTIGVYGAARDGAVLDEQSELAPDNMYGRTKAAAEQVVRGATGIETCIVRISETYGPHDTRLLKLFRAIDKGRYLTIGSGRNVHQPIYVDDLVEGLFIAATRDEAAGETFVMAGAEQVTTNTMAEAIASAVGRRKSPTRVPMWPFMLLAVGMETLLPPLRMRPPLHRRRLDFFRKSFRFSTGKAARALGFAARTSFADGARRTAAWYRDQRLL